MTFRYTSKRLISQSGLMLLTLLGLTASITLIVSIPMYVDAVHHKILVEKILSHNTGGEGLPYSFHFAFYGLWSGKSDWEDVEPLDEYLTRAPEQELELPMLRIARFINTDVFEIASQDQVNQIKSQVEKGFARIDDDLDSIGLVSLGVLDDIENHINLVDGSFPQPATSAGDSPVDVLVSMELANKFGFQVGEEYTLAAVNRNIDRNTPRFILPVHIAGVWTFEDPRDPFWFVDPMTLEKTFLIPEQTFINRISPGYDKEVSFASWHLVMDGTEVNADQVSAILEKIDNFEKKAGEFLPNFRALRSPATDLRNFQSSAQGLVILLYIFTIPVFFLILLFIFLLANLSIDRRKNEIAILRSRGASSWQVLTTIIWETIFLGILALILSYPLGMLVTKGIGLTRTFMDFSTRSNLYARVSQAALVSGGITVIFISIVSIVPAISAVRHTITSYKQERARQLKKPLWQRIYLDIMLFIPAIYGSYMLWKRGNLMPEGVSDPLSDPLLYLIPSLLVLSVTLLMLRILPNILEAFSHILNPTPSIGILLSVRHLSRSKGYEIPLIILVMTLGLAIYTSSLAETLDSHLFAQINYQTGTDVRFIKVGRNTPNSFMPTGQNPSQEVESLSFPVSEFLKIPNVTGATRVGIYPVYIRPLTGPRSNGVFIGVERLDFPRIAYWREDFSRVPLPHLLNALGAVPEGVLVSQSFLDETGIKEGDTLELAIHTDLGRIVFQAQVVGSLDYFPTWYEEEDGPVFVGNLDFIFDQVGGYAPYQVWVTTSPGFDYKNIRNLQVSDFNVSVLNWMASSPRITTIQERPEQQGIFGFLFIGYISAAVMTVTGFLLYALYSFQARYVELGVLRASGLSRRQMAITMSFELLFLILIGGILGTAFGVWMSDFYIPFLQLGDTPMDQTPPFQVIISWDSIYQIYAIFGFLFLVTLIILLTYLQRIKIFQAIKMGETQ